jgi:hypothetical protein
MGDEHPKRDEWEGAFEGAPADIQAVARQKAPEFKRNKDLKRRGEFVDRVAPNDEAKHMEAVKLHCVHGDTAFGMLAGFDRGRFFFNCSAHVMMNNSRDAMRFVGPVKSGKMRFTAKRQAAERALGRTKFLKWELDDSGSDDGEDEKEEDGPISVWPWQMSAEDHALWTSDALDALQLWDAPESGFRMPKDMFNRVGHFKIHDWMALAGSAFAYVLAQCAGIAADQKTVLVDFTYCLVSTYPLYII